MKKSLGAKAFAFPTPVWVIGTYDREGNPNVMTVAWGGICSSTPPCVAISVRKATYTYGNLMEKKAFTVNIPSEAFAKETDYFGTYSGRDEKKFAVTGLTPVRADQVDAPYVKEFPLILECRLLHGREVGIHTHFVGEIVDIKADETVLGENGMPDIEKVKPLLYSPENRVYHGVGRFIGKAYNIGRK
jgi:flavin reductase (DIM6/NTAB) family NADH-FMN oxidoreductase RutF